MRAALADVGQGNPDLTVLAATGRTRELAQSASRLRTLLEKAGLVNHLRGPGSPGVLHHIGEERRAPPQRPERGTQPLPPSGVIPFEQGSQALMARGDLPQRNRSEEMTGIGHLLNHGNELTE